MPLFLVCADIDITFLNIVHTPKQDWIHYFIMKVPPQTFEPARLKVENLPIQLMQPQCLRVTCGRLTYNFTSFKSGTDSNVNKKRI